MIRFCLNATQIILKKKIMHGGLMETPVKNPVACSVEYLVEY